MQSIAGSTAVLPILGQAQTQDRVHAAHQAIGPPPYTIRVFNPRQLEALQALTETVIPADSHSPGATAARVYEYIDAIASESAALRKRWIDGIEAIDHMSQKKHGAEYARCTALQQISMLTELARNEDRAATREERFFVLLKRATVDGYYTSAIGIHQDLEYHGNAALAEFPGCAHPEHGKRTTE